MPNSRPLKPIVAGLLIIAACGGDVSQPTTTPSIGPTTTTSTRPMATTVPEVTTTVAPQPKSPVTFLIPEGEEGVTFEREGDPPAGPSSFTILTDGSVVVADTMSASRGEPRLLRYDRQGELVAVIDLADEGVAAIVDVVSNGSDLAVLDVFIAMERYRILVLDAGGAVVSEIEIPEGSRFEAGLTGLRWDDTGLLLEFEYGVRYSRILETGQVEPGVIPVFSGVEVEIGEAIGDETSVRVGSDVFQVERPSDLGGVTLVGIGPDGSVVLILDEVDTSGPAIRVLQHVRRYSLDGSLLWDFVLDVGDQQVEIGRPWELAADGTVVYLAALSDGARVTVEDDLAAR